MEEEDANSLKKNTCQVCKKSFPSSTNLKVHLRTHDKVRPYFCCYCKWSFRQYSHLRRHIEKVHKNGLSVKTARDRFECKECHKCYTTFQKLMCHDLLVHQKSQFLTCQLCDVRHGDLDDLMQHYKLIHSDALCLKNDQLYICSNDGCDLTFENIVELKEHLLNHEDEDSCGVGATQDPPMQVGKSLFDGEGFDDAGKGPEQRLKKKLSEQEKLPCKICSKRFLSVENLTLHTVKCHMSSDATTCIKCGKSYKKAGSARIHIRYLRCPVFRRELESEGVKICDVIPSLEKTTCSICSLSFRSIHLLQIHMRKHNGIKPYQCEQCGKSFTQGGNLKTHIQSMHEGKKKAANEECIPKKHHQCNICEKLCSSAVDLKVHKRVHDETKPFKCQHCGRGFSQKGNLNIHITRRVDGVCPDSKKPKGPTDENINFATFPINRKVEVDAQVHNSPDYLITSFKVTDLVPARPVNVLISLATACIVTSSVTNVDFNVKDNNYIEAFSETDSTTDATTPVAGLTTVVTDNTYFVDGSDEGVGQGGLPVQETSTITRKELVEGQENSICQEVNVITAGISDETVDFSIVHDSPVTTPIDDSTTMTSFIDNTQSTASLDNEATFSKELGTRNVFKCEETNVITNSNESFKMIDVSSRQDVIPALEQLGNARASNCNGRETVVRSSPGNFLEQGCDNVSADMINEEITFLDNPYINSAYDIFEGNSINCEKYIESKDNSLNSREVNVISCLNSPFVDTGLPLESSERTENIIVEDGSHLCKEINVISAVSTQSYSAMFNEPIATNVHNASCRLMPETESDLFRKGINVIAGFNANSFNTTVISNSSASVNVDNIARHPHPCMETNVIKVGHKTRTIVSPNHQINADCSFKIERNETNVQKDDEIGDVCIEDCIIDNIYDFDSSPVKNTSVCKETNVIKGLLSSFELPNTYIGNNFVRELIPMEDDSYPCQEVNVITGVSTHAESSTIVGTSLDRLEGSNEKCRNANVISAPLATKYVDTNYGSQFSDDVNKISHISQETYVITSLGVPIGSESRSVLSNADLSSDINSSCKETTVIRIASMPLEDTGVEDEESAVICQVTNVITGVSEPLHATTVTCKDTLMDDKSFDIIGYSSKSCKQTNVIRHNTAPEKDSSTELVDMSYLSECPYICQVTNVITSVSFSVENTNSYLKGSNISGPDSNRGEARPFNDMTSNFVNGISSPFESTDPFEPSPSFESIEEELVPYESIQNQPTFLALEETKDFESINFNTLYQGLFNSVPTTSAKTQVIVNNSIFNENFFNYIEQPDQMQTHNDATGDCTLLSDDENEFTDLNWYQNYQLPVQASNLDNLHLSSVATVIKNVSGGEVKDIEQSGSATMRISTSSEELSTTCDELEDET